MATVRSASRWGALVAAASIVAISGLPGTPARAADTNYRALAVADAVRFTFIAVDAPATNVPFEFGAPTAQASLDSLGTNQSFAALPYPGDLAIAGPGLAAGVSNNAVTLPNYPAYVLADFPLTPIAKVDQPIYGLLATADQHKTSSSATYGADGDTPFGFSKAIADSQVTADAVIATSRSETNNLTAGPLTIAKVVSTASARQGETGPVTKESSLVVSGAKIGEIPITIGPKGISTGTSDTPLPDGSPLIQALAQAGVTLTYLKAEETAESINSPALQISFTKPIPGPVKSVGYIINLGRASASVPDGGALGTAPTTDTTPVSDSGIITDEASVSTSAGTDTGTQVVAGPALPAPAQSVGSAAKAEPAYTVGATPLQVVPRSVSLLSAEDVMAKPAFDTGDTYTTTALALIGLVGLVLLAGPVFRLFTKGSATS